MTRLAWLAMAPILLILACAANPPRPAGYVRPEVLMGPPPPIFFGSGTTAPVTVDLQISNTGALPIVIRRVRIESPGMSQYQLRPSGRDYRETIASGDLKVFSLSAMAFASRERLDPTEPLMLHATIEMETGGSWVREVYILRPSR